MGLLIDFEPDDLAEQFAHDPRVKASDRRDSFSFTIDEVNYLLRFSGVLGWCLCAGPKLEFVQLPKGRGVTNADFAICGWTAGPILAELLGDPRT